jgi:pyruvate kinase
MERMIRAGMNVARLNFSHGDFAYHGRLIATLRSAAHTAGRDVAILADLPGPKMRIGRLASEPVELAPGQEFTLTTAAITGNATRAAVSFERLPAVVRTGDQLFLNDGLIQLEVTAVGAPEVRCRVVAGGDLRSRKGLNIPGIDLGVSAFTEHDRECLRFAIANGVDLVSQSFVESAADLERVRAAAAECGRVPFLIAKIERSRALERIDEILAAADGMMVARGDLGVEVPIERMAVIQKDLLRRAVRAGKPVITATQMLESMTAHPLPTRAEATDVANAILDGTDAVMLSGESATGKYPVEAVAILARIAAATELTRNRFELWERLKTLDPAIALSMSDLAALSVEALFAGTTAALVLAPTQSGATPRSITRFHLPVWIAAPSESEATRRALLLSYGVHPLPAPADPAPDWSAYVRRLVREEGLSGRLAILVVGPSRANPGVNHRVELIELEPLAST